MGLLTLGGSVDLSLVEDDLEKSAIVWENCDNEEVQKSRIDVGGFYQWCQSMMVEESLSIVEQSLSISFRRRRLWRRKEGSTMCWRNVTKSSVRRLLPKMNHRHNRRKPPTLNISRKRSNPSVSTKSKGVFSNFIVSLLIGWPTIVRVNEQNGYAASVLMNPVNVLVMLLTRWS